MPQTSVTTAPAIGTPGEPSDLYTGLNGQVVSAQQEEASALIVPGIMTIAGTGDYSAKIPTGTTNKLKGIAMRAHDASDLDFDFDATIPGWRPGAELPIGRTGRYFVRIEENVTPASDVRVRMVAAGSEVAGTFRATADSTDCLEITAFAKWVRTALAADGVGELEINMGMADLAVADT